MGEGPMDCNAREKVLTGFAKCLYVVCDLHRLGKGSFEGSKPNAANSSGCYT